MNALATSAGSRLCAAARGAAVGLPWECSLGVTGCRYVDCRGQVLLLLHRAGYCAECLQLSGAYWLLQWEFEPIPLCLIVLSWGVTMKLHKKIV